MKLKTTLITAAIAALALPGQALAAPKAKLRFATATVVTSEGATQAVVTVTREARKKGNAATSLNTAVSVNYATSNGTAGAGDYTAKSGTLQFASGDTSESFTVPITQDGNVEGPETVNLTL